MHYQSNAHLHNTNNSKADFLEALRSWTGLSGGTRPGEAVRSFKGPEQGLLLYIKNRRYPPYLKELTAHASHQIRSTVCIGFLTIRFLFIMNTFILLPQECVLFLPKGNLTRFSPMLYQPNVSAYHMLHANGHSSSHCTTNASLEKEKPLPIHAPSLSNGVAMETASELVPRYSLLRGSCLCNFSSSFLSIPALQCRICWDPRSDPQVS